MWLAGSPSSQLPAPRSQGKVEKAMHWIHSCDHGGTPVPQFSHLTWAQAAATPIPAQHPKAHSFSLTFGYGQVLLDWTLHSQRPVPLGRVSPS